MSDIRSSTPSSHPPHSPRDNSADNPTKLIKSRTDGALRRHSLVDHTSYFFRIFIILAIACLFYLRSTILRCLAGFWLLPKTYQFLASVLFLSALLSAAPAVAKRGKAYFVFAWNCFLKPFLTRGKPPVGIDDAEDHQKRLEKFYEGQADVYDVTRKR